MSRRSREYATGHCRSRGRRAISSPGRRVAASLTTSGSRRASSSLTRACEAPLSGRRPTPVELPAGRSERMRATTRRGGRPLRLRGGASRSSRRPSRSLTRCGRRAEARSPLAGLEALSGPASRGRGARPRAAPCDVEVARDRARSGQRARPAASAWRRRSETRSATETSSRGRSRDDGARQSRVWRGSDGRRPLVEGPGSLHASAAAGGR